MPVPQRFEVHSGSARLVGERVGSGLPLICLHAGVADRRMFEGQQAELSRVFDMVSYDRRGFGETTTPDEPFSHVDDLMAVMNAAGFESAVVLGCSQGGRVAIDFALENAGCVLGLVLISSAVTGAPAVPDPADIQVLMDRLDEVEEAGDLASVNAIEAHLWLDGPRSAESRVEGSARDLFLEMNGIALKHPPLTQEREPEAAFGRLEALLVPCLLMHGTLDFPHLIARHAHMASVLPDAEAVACAGQAHLPPLENPALVNRHIFAFCRARGLL